MRDYIEWREFYVMIVVAFFVVPVSLHIYHYIVDKPKPVCYATWQKDGHVILTRIGDGKCNTYLMFYNPLEVKP